MRSSDTAGIPDSVSTVTITLRLQTAVRQDGDQWLAWCLPLDIITQADTRHRAKKALKEAVDLWFESCLERGTLDAALREAGFQKLSPGATPPSDSSVVTVSANAKSGPARTRKSGRAAAREFADAGFLEVSIPAYAAASSLTPHATC